jgi:hypothetical protein
MRRGGQTLGGVGEELLTMRGLAPLAAVAVAAFLVSCADEKAVNAAFFQNKVSWYVFDATAASGVQPLAGFDQPLAIAWKPADRAVYAAETAPTAANLGAVAVSGLGLLLADDSSGVLDLRRPQSSPSLTGYRTGGLFNWGDKTFLTLYREPGQPAANGSPSITLAWWAPGNERLAFYPLPTQARDALAQAVRVETVGASQTPATLEFVWKSPVTDGYEWFYTRLDLATGSERALEVEPPPGVAPTADEAFAPLSQRLAARLGSNVSAISARSPNHLLLVTPQGWAATGEVGSTESRLYRLPEIGAAGRYTHALALARGFLLTWETRWRGYVGSAGLVYVPFAVVGP